MHSSPFDLVKILLDRRRKCKLRGFIRSDLSYPLLPSPAFVRSDLLSRVLSCQLQQRSYPLSSSGTPKVVCTSVATDKIFVHAPGVRMLCAALSSRGTHCFQILHQAVLKVSCVGRCVGSTTSRRLSTSTSRPRCATRVERQDPRMGNPIVGFKVREHAGA